MSTAEFSATMEAAGTARAGASNAIGQTGTDAATASTDVATALSAFDTAAADVIAITGDTYSNTTHQYTFGGSTGLTYAQWATFGALLNTAVSDVITVASDIATIVADAAAIDSGADVTVRVGSRTNVATLTELKTALDKIRMIAAGSGWTP